MYVKEIYNKNIDKSSVKLIPTKKLGVYHWE